MAHFMQRYVFTAKLQFIQHAFPSEEQELLTHKDTIIHTRLNRLNIVAHGDVHKIKTRRFAVYIK